MLPSQIQDKLSNSEKEYFQAYSSSLGQYMSTIDVDISVVWWESLNYTAQVLAHDSAPRPNKTLQRECSARGKCQNPSC